MSIKKAIKKLAEKVFQSNWYPNKKILLESVPDMGSQTFPVYNYMIEQGLNKKYKIIWMVNNPKEFKDIKTNNVKFIPFEYKTRIGRFRRMYLLCTSRAMLYSHRYIDKVFDKQVLFYLRHGSFIKSRLQHAQTEFLNQCDACVCMSPFFDEIEEKQMMISHERFVYTGYPNDDYILEETDYSKALFPDESFEKIIMWLPTFRQMKNSDRIDSTFSFPLGIPCLYSEEQCVELNNVLKEKNVLLLLKPHPGQDMSRIKNIELSNLRIISDNDLKNAGVQLYQYLGSTDAMITDYSSVYYDYLLTDNIIGITIDDYETYGKDSGFAVDYFNVVVGEYIKDYKDMIEFVNNVANGVDPSFNKRQNVKNMVFDHCDATNTKRVYDVLISLLNERYGKH